MQDSQEIITIVYADDSDEMRTLVRQQLEKESDLDVIGEAGSGQEALELVHRLNPDIVLLDLEMPVMDGIEAARQLLDEGARSKILLYCYEVDLDTREKLKSMGIAGLIEKGGNPWNFANAIRRAAAGGNI